MLSAADIRAVLDGEATEGRAEPEPLPAVADAAGAAELVEWLIDHMDPGSIASEEDADRFNAAEGLLSTLVAQSEREPDDDPGVHLDEYGCNVFHAEGRCRWQGGKP